MSGSNLLQYIKEETSRTEKVDVSGLLLLKRVTRYLVGQQEIGETTHSSPTLQNDETTQLSTTGRALMHRGHPLEVVVSNAESASFVIKRSRISTRKARELHAACG